MKNLADEVERLQKILAQDSRSIEFARLADYLREMNKTDEAIEVCQKGIEQHPHYANAHFILGRCYFEIGDLDVAESEFNKTLLYDAEHINAHHYQANIMKKREWQNAHVLWVKRALVIDPMDSTALLMLDSFEESSETELELSSETEPAEWWATEPPLGRVANGVADRVGQLRALGNGVVPAVVAEFLRLLVKDSG